jgi:hypothetical protein
MLFHSFQRLPIRNVTQNILGPDIKYSHFHLTQFATQKLLRNLNPGYDNKTIEVV